MLAQSQRHGSNGNVSWCVQDTIGLTMPAMTAWMDKELRGLQLDDKVRLLLSIGLSALWLNAVTVG